MKLNAVELKSMRASGGVPSRYHVASSAAYTVSVSVYLAKQTVMMIKMPPPPPARRPAATGDHRVVSDGALFALQKRITDVMGKKKHTETPGCRTSCSTPSAQFRERRRISLVTGHCDQLGSQFPVFPVY